jgi:hypothetical protein
MDFGIRTSGTLKILPKTGDKAPRHEQTFNPHRNPAGEMARRVLLAEHSARLVKAMEKENDSIVDS